MPKDLICFTLIANAGLQVKCGGSVILLDAFFEKQPGFSAPSPKALEGLMCRKPPFEEAACLLLSHSHPDHFSPALFARYLEGARPGIVVMPGKMPLMEPIAKAMAASGQPHRFLTEADDFVTVPLGGGNTIAPVKTVHMGPDFAHVLHFAFLASLGGRNVLFAADSGGLENDYRNLLRGHKVDILVANPLFLMGHASYRTLEELSPEAVLVYHLPFPQDDTKGMRKITEHRAQRLSALCPNMILLGSELQTQAL